MEELDVIAKYLGQGSAIGSLAVLVILLKSVTKAISNDISHIHEEIKGMREDIRSIRDDLRFSLIKK